jgi:hypothetical protein
MAVTGQIVAVVSVLEHMIIGGNCYFSLREQGEGIIIETAKKELPRYNRGSFKKVPQKIG